MCKHERPILYILLNGDRCETFFLRLAIWLVFLWSHFFGGPIIAARSKIKKEDRYEDYKRANKMLFTKECTDKVLELIVLAALLSTKSVYKKAVAENGSVLKS